MSEHKEAAEAWLDTAEADYAEGKYASANAAAQIARAHALLVKSDSRISGGIKRTFKDAEVAEDGSPEDVGGVGPERR